MTIVISNNIDHRLDEIKRRNSIYNEVSTDEEMDESDHDKSDTSEEINKNEKFCATISKFLENLIKFAKYVNSPTKISTDKIQKKKMRDFTFDIYVDATMSFNNIMHESLLHLRNVIISLNTLFINKNVDDITDFLENLRIFLLFLLNESVFDKLYNLQILFVDIYNENIDIICKLSDMKKLIFKICNLSIDITSIFIPPVSIFKNAIKILEEKHINQESQIEEVNDNKNSINNVIKQLSVIQLNAFMITDKKIKNVQVCLFDKKAITVTRTIENLQNEYIELLHLTSSLRAEINAYKNKKKNNLISVMQKLFR